MEAVGGLRSLRQARCFIFSRIWVARRTGLGKSLFFKCLAAALQQAQSTWRGGNCPVHPTPRPALGERSEPADE